MNITINPLRLKNSAILNYLFLNVSTNVDICVFFYTDIITFKGRNILQILDRTYKTFL